MKGQVRQILANQVCKGDLVLEDGVWHVVGMDAGQDAYGEITLRDERSHIIGTYYPWWKVEVWR